MCSFFKVLDYLIADDFFFVFWDLVGLAEIPYSDYLVFMLADFKLKRGLVQPCTYFDLESHYQWGCYWSLQGNWSRYTRLWRILVLSARCLVWCIVSWNGWPFSVITLHLVYGREEVSNSVILRAVLCIRSPPPTARAGLLFVCWDDLNVTFHQRIGVGRKGWLLIQGCLAGTPLHLWFEDCSLFKECNILIKSGTATLVILNNWLAATSWEFLLSIEDVDIIVLGWEKGALKRILFLGRIMWCQLFTIWDGLLLFVLRFKGLELEWSIFFDDVVAFYLHSLWGWVVCVLNRFEVFLVFLVAFCSLTGYWRGSFRCA